MVYLFKLLAAKGVSMDVEAGAESRGIEGDTPLLRAVEHKRTKLVQTLLLLGARPTPRVIGFVHRLLTGAREEGRVNDVYAAATLLTTLGVVPEPA